MSHGQNMGLISGIRSSAPHNHNGILENEDVNPYKSIDDHAPIWETNPCLDRDTYITLYNYLLSLLPTFLWGGKKTIAILA